MQVAYNGGYDQIHGYHVYKEIWCVDVGEELSCMREVENYRNPFAVVVVRSINQSIHRLMATPPANRVWGGGGLQELTRRLLFHGFNFDSLPINRKNHENWTP